MNNARIALAASRFHKGSAQKWGFLPAAQRPVTWKVFSTFIQSWIAAPENREIEAVGALRFLKQKLGQSVQDLEREMERLEDDLIYIPLKRQKFIDFYHAFRMDIALDIQSELKNCFTRAEIVMAA